VLGLRPGAACCLLAVGAAAVPSSAAAGRWLLPGMAGMGRLGLLVRLLVPAWCGAAAAAAADTVPSQSRMLMAVPD
jgi:hypothetical protein